MEGDPIPVMAATHILAFSKSTFLEERTPEAMQSCLDIIARSRCSVPVKVCPMDEDIKGAFSIAPIA